MPPAGQQTACAVKHVHLSPQELETQSLILTQKMAILTNIAFINKPKR